MGLKVKADPKTGIFQLSGTLGGYRIRESTKTRDRKAAEAAARATEREYWQRRAAGNAEVVMFETAVASYKRAGGDGRFTDPLTVHFAGTPVRDVLPGHVKDAAYAIYPTAKPATWNRQVLTPASAILNHAAERGWCAPIRIKRFEEERAQRRAVDRTWLDGFMAHASPELAALALFMFTTGARISDALSLEWAGVTDRRALIETKTGRREAVLSREMVARLRTLTRHNDRVFRYKSKRWVYTQWYAACDRAGIERIPPHQAGRHSFATEMIVRQRVDAQTTAKLGGWKSTRMLDRYTHPEKLEGVVDDVFGAPGPRERKA